MTTGHSGVEKGQRQLRDTLQTREDKTNAIAWRELQRGSQRCHYQSAYPGSVLDFGRMSHVVHIATYPLKSQGRLIFYCSRSCFVPLGHEKAESRQQLMGNLPASIR